MLPSMSHPQHSRTIRIGGRSDFVPKLGLVILTSEPGDRVAYLWYVVNHQQGTRMAGAWAWFGARVG